jgi:repressor LexA
MLTGRQRELLKYINEKMKETGVSPSYDEMRIAVNLSSKSGIHRLINALEERGFIRRLANRARAIEIIKFPEELFSSYNGSKFEPKIISNKSNTGIEDTLKTNTINIPLMGSIAAGTPITAIQNLTDNIPYPANLLSNHEHYALKIRGDSMVNAGILDGDTVIIKKTETAISGDIVVALIDNEEATLKKFRKRGDSIALEAANPNFETKIFGPDRIKVQGCMVGLMRSY